MAKNGLVQSQKKTMQGLMGEYMHYRLSQETAYKKKEELL